MSTPEEIEARRKVFTGAAKAGRWDWIDQNLRDENIAREDLNWAAHIADVDENDDVRDLAATYWCKSSLPFADADEQHMMHWMAEESSDIVQMRLAIALYKRGNRSAHTLELREKALVHPEVGPDAAKYAA